MGDETTKDDGVNWEEVTLYIQMGADFAKGILDHVKKEVGHGPTDRELFPASIGVIGSIANATYGLMLRSPGGRPSADLYMRSVLMTLEKDLNERRGIKAKIEITFEN